jgi:hypothetical protein
LSLKRKRLIRKRLLIGLVLVSTAFLAYEAQLVTIERHRGYFAPVWDPSGRSVYFIQRDTVGVTWGLGWEHVTAPASVYVFSDTLKLRRIERAGKTPDTLLTWRTTPVAGRIIREYRGRVFTALSARIDTGESGLTYRVRMSIPRVPRADTWSLQGRWSLAGSQPAPWRQADVGMSGYAEHRLVQEVEVVTVPGRERFPAAIVAVRGDGRYDVLLRNDAFTALYPRGIPVRKLREQSLREMIERHRTIARTRTRLIEELSRKGMSEGEAMLEADERLEELGYYPKGPRLLARPLAAPPAGAAVFHISEEEFRVGLFADIRAAIENVGREIDKSMSHYIVHRDFDTSRRLNAWLDAGHRRFVVEHRERYYEMEIKR